MKVPISILLLFINTFILLTNTKIKASATTLRDAPSTTTKITSLTASGRVITDISNDLMDQKGTLKYNINESLQERIEGLIAMIEKWKEKSNEYETFVTLTYAQTLDGMIATSNKTKFFNNGEKDMSSSSNLVISCEESFLMTHALRSIHDAILVGGNTLYADNPRLNNRLWKDKTGEKLQPIPVVLDTELRNVLRIIREGNSIKASKNRRCIVCCSRDAYEEYGNEIMNTISSSKHKSSTIQLLVCERNKIHDVGREGKVRSGKGLDLKCVLQKLYKEYGIKSLMVEGGASIISEFAANAEECVDCVCVVIAPKMFGGVRGLNALNGANLVKQCNDERTHQMLEYDADSLIWTKLGADCVFLAPCPKYMN